MKSLFTSATFNQGVFFFFLKYKNVQKQTPEIKAEIRDKSKKADVHITAGENVPVSEESEELDQKTFSVVSHSSFILCSPFPWS